MRQANNASDKLHAIIYGLLESSSIGFTNSNSALFFIKPIQTLDDLVDSDTGCLIDSSSKTWQF
jgi:hypothetical protein